MLSKKSNKYSVLLIDDEEYLCEAIAETLSLLGYQVYKYCEANAAIKFFEENFKNINLVILDMIMPDISGRDVFFKLKDIDINAKIIISTGLIEKETYEELLKEGALAFIKKPFRLSNILEVTKNVFKCDDKL
ncbi:MAG: response regulator [Desulfobacterales bacterium]|nr:response regulator [Desulfobacterales bacterium]